MHIFIDESGNFAMPPLGNRNLSCVGALVIPQARFNEVSERFVALKAQWGTPNGEIKGSRLSEPQVAAVIDLLIDCGCLFFVAATEMSVNDVAAMNVVLPGKAWDFSQGPVEGRRSARVALRA